MRYEFSRQLIHLGGLVFVLLAQFTGRFTGSLIFFLIALGFFVYSEFINRNRESPGHIRKLTLKLDRKVGKPFIGAFWFINKTIKDLLWFKFGIKMKFKNLHTL